MVKFIYVLIAGVQVSQINRAAIVEGNKRDVVHFVHFRDEMSS